MRTVLRPTIVLSFLLLAAGAADGAGKVFVVQQTSPGIDGDSIPNALLQASDGDTILVKPGAYATATVTKGVALVGDVGATGTRPKLRHVFVQGVPATARVLLRGLEIEAPNAIGGGATALEIDQCAAAVLVEDCSVRIAGAASQDSPSIFVRDSDRVVLTRTEIRGNETNGVIAGRGLRAEGSVVSLYSCDVRGGRGRDANTFPFAPMPADDGAVAIDAVGGRLLLAGCTVTGGAGGDGALGPTGCLASGDGAVGLRLDGNAEAHRLDSTIAGGAAGVDVSGCPQVGVPAAALDLVSGTLATVNESIRTLAVPSPLREGQQTTLVLTGVPGELPVVLLSAQADPTFLVASLSGTLLTSLTPPLLTLVPGPLPPNGTLQLPAILPPHIVSPPIDFVELHLQVLVAGATGFGVLGSGTTVTLLDGTL